MGDHPQDYQSIANIDYVNPHDVSLTPYLIGKKEPKIDLGRQHYNWETTHQKEYNPKHKIVKPAPSMSPENKTNNLIGNG